ncbi:MAG: hypothetical protein R3F17_10495 [Planctomycetota bacterium]
MPAFDEATVDLPALDSQTRQLFKSGVTIGALVGLYLIWASALPALEDSTTCGSGRNCALSAPPMRCPATGYRLRTRSLSRPPAKAARRRIR